MTQVSIASGSQLSADAGAVVANRGGNAVDAAISTALVSMCTNPGIMAPGGSGFITIWAPAENPITIDAYVEIFEDSPTISYEPGLKLAAMSGFKLRKFPQKSMYSGGVHAALWNPKTGLSEIADPLRGGGTARGGL